MWPFHWSCTHTHDKNIAYMHIISMEIFWFSYIPKCALADFYYLSFWQFLIYIHSSNISFENFHLGATLLIKVPLRIKRIYVIILENLYKLVIQVEVIDMCSNITSYYYQYSTKNCFLIIHLRNYSYPHDFPWTWI